MVPADEDDVVDCPVVTVFYIILYILYLLIFIMEGWNEVRAILTER